MLDIGCWSGQFLSLITNARHITGVDIAADAIDFAKRQKRGKYLVASALHLPFKDGQFDVVTMWDVIEHLYNPTEIFQEIHRILKKDGVLCFVTPNINSFMAHLFRQKWWFLLQSHVYYFTPRSMNAVMEKTGFKIIETGTYGRSFTMAYWATKLKSYSSKFYEMVNQCLRTLSLDQMPLNLNLGDHMMVYARKGTEKKENYG